MQIKVDNIITNYELIESQNPEESKQSIVILHGWGRSLEEWKPIAKTLEKNSKILLVDLPGFGKSQPPTEPWDTNKYADFLENLFTKLNIRNPILIGHSFGGKVSIVLASRDVSITKLILIAASGINIRNLKTNLVIVLAQVLKPLEKVLPQSIVYKIKNKFRDADYKNAGTLKDTLSNILKEDFTPLLHKIKCETLVVWGNRDEVLPVTLTKIFKQRIPRSRVKIVWGAKHSPHLEKPEKLTEILLESL